MEKNQKIFATTEEALVKARELAQNLTRELIALGSEMAYSEISVKSATLDNESGQITARFHIGECGAEFYSVNGRLFCNGVVLVDIETRNHSIGSKHLTSNDDYCIPQCFDGCRMELWGQYDDIRSLAIKINSIDKALAEFVFTVINPLAEIDKVFVLYNKGVAFFADSMTEEEKENGRNYLKDIYTQESAIRTEQDSERDYCCKRIIRAGNAASLFSLISECFAYKTKSVITIKQMTAQEANAELAKGIFKD